MFAVKAGMPERILLQAEGHGIGMKMEGGLQEMIDNLSNLADTDSSESLRTWTETSPPFTPTTTIEQAQKTTGTETADTENEKRETYKRNEEQLKRNVCTLRTIALEPVNSVFVSCESRGW
jgi:hypothetical protein